MVVGGRGSFIRRNGGGIKGLGVELPAAGFCGGEEKTALCVAVGIRESEVASGGGGGEAAD